MPDFDLDAALMPDEPKNEWVHCNGDCNGWEYGAMWYNAAIGNIVAVRGIEGVPEIWAHEIEVPTEVKQAAERRAAQDFPDPEDGDCREEQIDNEVGDWQEAERERRVDAQTQEVHEWSCDDCTEDYNVASIIDSFGMTRDQWDAMELCGKWCCIANHYGLHELDYDPVRLTRAELKAKLGGLDI